MARRSEATPRRWRRRTVSLDVAYATSEGSRNARATTLGAGGLFIRVAAAPPEDTPIRVRFTLPGSPVVQEIDGRVAWILRPVDAGSHAPGMGIAFTDPQQIARLAEALEACTPPETQREAPADSAGDHGLRRG